MPLQNLAQKRSFKRGIPLKTLSFLSSEAQVPELVKQDHPVFAILEAFYTSPLIFKRWCSLSTLYIMRK